MKQKILLVLVAQMLCLGAFAQTDKEQVRKTFNAYFKTLEKKDVKACLDMIYPKFFEHVSVEMMTQTYEQTWNDTNIIISFSDPIVSKVSEVLTVDGVKYALISYSYKLAMHIAKEIPGAPTTEQILQGMKTKYGEANVHFDKEKNTIELRETNQIYVINNPVVGSWKMLERRDRMRSVMEALLPDEVRKKL